MPLYGYINHEIKEEILIVINFLNGFWVVTQHRLDIKCCRIQKYFDPFRLHRQRANLRRLFFHTLIEHNVFWRT